MTIEPRPRQWLPPSPEQQAAAAASAATFRAEQEERRAVERPLREAMAAALTGHGVVLRDPPAALDCPCGCHPRLDLGAHGGAGQAACGCQQTPEERRTAMQQLFASLAGASPELELLRAEEQNVLAARAAELGVRARIAVGMAPFVLTGTVDGRAFYLRERHGLWRVTIAPDDDPTSDPWAADPSVPALDIADGDADRLLVDDGFSVVRALEVAVGSVRSFLRQRECEHGRALPGDRFCAACGAALVAPESP
ncbi:MAG: hypothetical protein M3Q22_07175 [Actinomycetota bacterium]|nr:hypothetical protein [Actinomycetota bacterium]